MGIKLLCSLCVFCVWARYVYAYNVWPIVCGENYILSLYIYMNGDSVCRRWGGGGGGVDLKAFKWLENRFNLINKIVLSLWLDGNRMVFRL